MDKGAIGEMRKFTDTQRLQYLINRPWLPNSLLPVRDVRGAIDDAMRESLARKASRKRKKK